MYYHHTIQLYSTIYRYMVLNRKQITKTLCKKMFVENLLIMASCSLFKQVFIGLVFICNINESNRFADTSFYSLFTLYYAFCLHNLFNFGYISFATNFIVLLCRHVHWSSKVMQNLEQQSVVLNIFRLVFCSVSKC